MSYIKRSIVLDDEITSEPSGAPVLGGRKIEPMGRTRPPLRIWSVIPTELAALLDAVESAAEEGSGFDLFDIEHVEAFWQVLEPCSAAHGYVLTLRGGSRVYLQLLTATDDDRPVEEVEVLPMRHERYPDLKGANIVWVDDVGELNRFLKV